MKQLPFDWIEVLPSLLNKTKTTTARKAWNDKATCFWCNKKFKDLVKHTKRVHEEVLPRSYDYEKPPKYEVGEIVELVWTGTSIRAIIDKGKILGKAKIIKREDIALDKMNILCVSGDRFKINPDDLAYTEGFRNQGEMFKKLEEYANGLETPKKFYLYSFKWVKI